MSDSVSPGILPLHVRGTSQDLGSVLDLHGKTVKEAVGESARWLDRHRTGTGLTGVRRLTLITGRGLHSPDGVPRIKPEIEKLLKRRKIRFKEESRNPGRLIVFLGAPSDVGPVV